MGTPFIKVLEPSDLSGYNSKNHYHDQSDTIPLTFIDAMEVRERVFVEEQGCPLANEFDLDDSRSVHWVVYASINKVIQPQETDQDGKITQIQESVTRSTPIGTIRLIPFPHHPHPEPGSNFSLSPTDVYDPPPTAIIPDRATTFHDGTEPYLKLGRLCVLKDHRGKANGSIAKQIVSAALQWARANPTVFNPSIARLGMESLGVNRIEDVPVWNGLVCVHAQVQAEKAWESWGFKTDEGMGRWQEEGIEHVGMFLRLEFAEQTTT